MQKNKKIITIAVIIPFYNGSSYIERAINSVLNQTIKPDEFIIVNDGSSINESKFIDDLSVKYNFKLINQINCGQGSARNTGVKNIKSDFICFLDQDDYYINKHIEILKESLPKDDENFGWVYGDLIEADGDGNIINSSITRNHGTHPKLNTIDFIKEDLFILPSAALISRSAFQSVGGFDERFRGYEDDDLFLRMHLSNFTNYYIDKPVTIWCIHTESTSYSMHMSRSRLLFIKKICHTISTDPSLHQSYIQSYIIPRFNNPVMGEALRSVSGVELKNTSVSDKKNTPELLIIMDEYIKIITSFTDLKCKILVKLNVLKFLIKTKNKNLNKAIFYIYKKITK